METILTRRTLAAAVELKSLLAELVLVLPPVEEKNFLDALVRERLYHAQFEAIDTVRTLLALDEVGR